MPRIGARAYRFHLVGCCGHVVGRPTNLAQAQAAHDCCCGATAATAGCSPAVDGRVRAAARHIYAAAAHDPVIVGRNVRLTKDAPTVSTQDHQSLDA